MKIKKAKIFENIGIQIMKNFIKDVSKEPNINTVIKMNDDEFEKWIKWVKFSCSELYLVSIIGIDAVNASGRLARRRTIDYVTEKRNNKFSWWKFLFLSR